MISSGSRTSGSGGDGTGGGSPPGANSRPPEEGLAAIVEQRGWGLDRTAPRRGRPPRANPGAKRATSVHLYGIRIGEVMIGTTTLTATTCAIEPVLERN